MARRREVKRQRRHSAPEAQCPDDTAIPGASLRMRAFLVDTFMVTMPIAYTVIYLVMGGGRGFEANRLLGWAIILAVHAPIMIGLWCLKGESPGMKAYDLKLVRAATGEPAGCLHAALRYLLLPVAVLSIFGMLLIVWRADRRGLHDLVSGTALIRRPR